jgi:hypothetical protein
MPWLATKAVPTEPHLELVLVLPNNEAEARVLCFT